MKKAFYGMRFAAFAVTGLFFSLLLFTHTDLAMQGVKHGLSLCTGTLIPSLFPFLVLSELLVVMQAGELFGRLFARPAKKLLGLSGSACVALVMGVFCGFPTAMSTGVALMKRGELRREELLRLSLFANIPSTGFLIGAVGEGLFGNRRAGTALFLITLSGALLIGFVLRVIRGCPTAKDPNIPPYVMRKGLSPADLTGCVKRGFSTMLHVVAFLLFFSAVIGCLEALPFFWELPAPFRALAAGMLEMTTGIRMSVQSLSGETAFILTAFLAGFSGLSVCLQLFSVAEEAKLRLLPYLLAKLLHGGLNAGLAKLYLLWAKPAFSPLKDVLWEAGAPLPRRRLPLFIFLVGLVLICGVYRQYAQKKKSPLTGQDKKKAG